MKDFKNILKSETHHLILAGLLAIFVVMDIKIPHSIAPFLNSIVGKTFIIVTALSLLAINPIVGIAAIIASFELIRRASSGSETTSPPSSSGLPTPQQPEEALAQLKITDIPLTLEEDVINNMLPRVATDVQDDPQFKPIQNKLYGAGKI
tara:strand:- start:250 stop:699 length:450 start_codon:yes stop_codon:yes gene_type:complete